MYSNEIVTQLYGVRIRTTKSCYPGTPNAWPQDAISEDWGPGPVDMGETKHNPRIVLAARHVTARTSGLSASYGLVFLSIPCGTLTPD